MGSLHRPAQGSGVLVKTVLLSKISRETPGQCPGVSREISPLLLPQKGYRGIHIKWSYFLEGQTSSREISPQMPDPPCFWPPSEPPVSWNFSFSSSDTGGQFLTPVRGQFMSSPPLVLSKRIKESVPTLVQDRIFRIDYQALISNSPGPGELEMSRIRNE